MAENISASMVKELRDQTGAGMMDCKAALNESGGNIDAAVDWLRKKGLSKAAKKAGRVAAEGLIGVATSATKGVVVEVNSETDFVARNELFQGLVKMIADVALGTGPDVNKILAAKAGSISVADAISDNVAKIGENMTLRRAAGLSVGQGLVGSYVHSSVIDGLGRIGVIVYVIIGNGEPVLEVFGPKIATLNGQQIPALRVHNSGSAHGRMTGAALSCIPAGVAVIMFYVNPDYVRFFFLDDVGNIMLGCAIVLQLIGYAIMRQIVKIEV